MKKEFRKRCAQGDSYHAALFQILHRGVEALEVGGEEKVLRHSLGTQVQLLRLILKRRQVPPA